MKDFLNNFLPVLINEYNELLKLHDYPIIEYVGFLDNKIPVSSLLEKSFIKTAEQSILWKVHQLPDNHLCLWQTCLSHQGLWMP